MRPILFVLAFLLVGFGSGIAQETTGAINGRVVDTQALAIPGVTVTVIGSQGTKTFTTDAEGRFSAPLASMIPSEAYYYLHTGRCSERSLRY